MSKNDNEVMDFSVFDKAVNTEQFKKDLENAKANAGEDYSEVPKGTYMVKIERMEIKPTKADKAPMFSVMCRILDGEYKKQCVFFNRKIYGNRESDKWNDAKAVQTVITWLDHLETETVPEFISYSQFNECILDIFDECEEYGLALKIEYDPDAFNPIKILEVYEA